MAPASETRIIYMLSWDERRRVVCAFYETRLLSWKAFRPIAIKRLTQLLSPGRMRAYEAADRHILPRLVPYEMPGGAEAALSDEDGFALLREIVKTGRAFLRDGNHLRVKWGKPRLGQPVWIPSPEGVDQPDWETELPSRVVLATTPPCYVGGDGRFDCIGSLETVWPQHAARAWIGTSLATEESVERFLALFINRHPAAKPPARTDDGRDRMMDCSPVPVLRIVRGELPASGGRERLLALEELLWLRLHFRYGNKEISWTDEREQIAFLSEGRTRCCRRKLDAEAEVRERLEALGFTRRAGGTAQALFDFHADDFSLSEEAGPTWDTLMKDVFPGLRKEGWDIANDAHLDLEVVASDRWSHQLEEQAGGWHTFEAVISFRRRRIPVLPLLRDFLRTHAHLSNDELATYFGRASCAVPAEKGGKLLLVPGVWLRSLFEALFELGFSQSLDKGGRLTLSRWRARELLALNGEILQSTEQRDPGGAGVDLELLRERLRAGNDPFAPLSDIPAELESLRDYQRVALGWLDFLRQTGTHGVLADDMGLGKTFQVLAHLSIEKANGRLEGAVLVVSPTSVIDNWIAEAAQRTPALRVHRHHGPKRREVWRDAIGCSDLVVTSYPVLREDVGTLAEVEWRMVILDEAQAIKNRQSQTFEAATALRGDRRLCLTGTPIENHLGELWAIFHFLMPFHLGRHDEFREEFQRPVAQVEANPRLAAERAALLARRLAPFILRRSKERVAPELPPKTEITHKVDLAPLQAQKYEGVRLQLVREIRDLLESRSLAQSQIHVLAALTRLRLLCCDPRIGSEGDSALAAEHSAKFERLFELLEELIGEGRRILVFSQFVEMLDLIEGEVVRRNWPSLKLTGQTADRADLVRRFNEGQVSIFLMSLKAGGVGLNLATADTVILYDPWWNPAVEAQATDRAHRIGQRNPVFVHRLVARGTVEEGMLQLHERKRAMVESVLDGLPGEHFTLDPQALAALFGEAF